MTCLDLNELKVQVTPTVRSKIHKTTIFQFGGNKNIAAGSVLCVCADSGRGKTVLLNTLALLPAYEPTASGQLTLECNGYKFDPRQKKPEPDQARKFRRRNIGIASSHCCLLPKLTLAQNISLGSAGSDSGNLAAIAESLNIDHALNQKAHNVHIDLQRKTIIARALIKRPRFLLLDDPVAGVSAQSAACIWTTIRQHVDRERTVIVAAIRPRREHAPAIWQAGWKPVFLENSAPPHGPDGYDRLTVDFAFTEAPATPHSCYQRLVAN
jgi:ABC-type lipoprotein export system ATPase subunit